LKATNDSDESSKFKIYYSEEFEQAVYLPDYLECLLEYQNPYWQLIRLTKEKATQSEWPFP
jgi:hypothetical protein